MKKLIAAILIAGLLSAPVSSLAMPVEFSGGVRNEYEYEEIAFLSGVPIKFVGSCKVDITESENSSSSKTNSKADKFDVVPEKPESGTSKTDKEKKPKKTVVYTFKLESADPANPGKFDRQMTYETVFSKNNVKGQTLAQTTVTKMKEIVTLGEDKYELKDYQFTKSDIIDNRPASDFYSGNIKARKIYTINKTEGKVTVDISGGEVGYDNFWGSTGTQILDYVVQYDRQDAGGDQSRRNEWIGTVRAQTSDSITKTIKYTENEANFSSFDGGNIKLTNRETISDIQIDLPAFKDGKVDGTNRNKSSFKLSKKMDPNIERLLLPKLRDTGGHWAEVDIEKLYSLGVYDENLQFFTPDIPMTRKEFVKAIMKSCNISSQLKAKPTSSRLKEPEVSPFDDVDTKGVEYPYIKEAVSMGIIYGTTENLFKPDLPLTRAEAVTVMIRALGFDNKAPTPGYKTNFDDDGAIPEWSKDCVYVAKEVGLVQGDDSNRFNPNSIMTRAEASAMLSRFLQFLQKDLQKDYRENIILFN